jgi:hypothetical protein
MAKDSIWNHIEPNGKWRHTRFDPRLLEAAGFKYPRPDPWARKLVSPACTGNPFVELTTGITVRHGGTKALFQSTTDS